jgi:hypothetical protein
MSLNNFNIIKIPFTLLAVCAITYCSDIDKRKLSPVLLGAASSSAVITGWSLYFIGNHIEDKNHNLYLNLSNGESMEKYYEKMIKCQNISKSGLWIQGFGGLFFRNILLVEILYQ